jgi:hypothetical protein
MGHTCHNVPDVRKVPEIRCLSRRLWQKVQHGLTDGLYAPLCRLILVTWVDSVATSRVKVKAQKNPHVMFTLVTKQRFAKHLKANQHNSANSSLYKEQKIWTNYQLLM